MPGAAGYVSHISCILEAHCSQSDSSRIRVRVTVARNLVGPEQYPTKTCEDVDALACLNKPS